MPRTNTWEDERAIYVEHIGRHFSFGHRNRSDRLLSSKALWLCMSTLNFESPSPSLRSCEFPPSKVLRPGQHKLSLFVAETLIITLKTGDSPTKLCPPHFPSFFNQLHSMICHSKTIRRSNIQDDPTTTANWSDASSSLTSTSPIFRPL